MFQKTECNHKEISIPITFYRQGFEHNYPYSFLDGYFRYHQIFITPKDMYNTTFVTYWGAFTWVVMSFGVKNQPPTYQRAINKTFKNYLDKFLEIFLDDFIAYNEMDTHLDKLRLCLQKCSEFGISLNPYECAFMVFSRMILGLIVSKESKLQNQARKSKPQFKCMYPQIHSKFKYSANG